MHERIQARLVQIKTDVETAQTRLQVLEAEKAELFRFLQAAAGAAEVLEELLKEGE